MMTKTGTMTMQVVSVMKQVDRGNYVRHNPYMDTLQSIGYINISAPHMHEHPML